MIGEKEINAAREALDKILASVSKHERPKLERERVLLEFVIQASAGSTANASDSK